MAVDIAPACVTFACSWLWTDGRVLPLPCYDHAQWKETQDNLKFTMQRQLYGVHMPVRQLMERSLVGQVSGHLVSDPTTWPGTGTVIPTDHLFALCCITIQSPHMPARGIMNNLHHDILTGNDELLETRDLFLGGGCS